MTRSARFVGCSLVAGLLVLPAAGRGRRRARRGRAEPSLRSASSPATRAPLAELYTERARVVAPGSPVRDDVRRSRPSSGASSQRREGRGALDRERGRGRPRRRGRDGTPRGRRRGGDRGPLRRRVEALGRPVEAAPRHLELRAASARLIGGHGARLLVLREYWRGLGRRPCVRARVALHPCAGIAESRASGSGGPNHRGESPRGVGQLFGPSPSANPVGCRRGRTLPESAGRASSGSSGRSVMARDPAIQVVPACHERRRDVSAQAAAGACSSVRPRSLADHGALPPASR